MQTTRHSNPNVPISTSIIFPLFLDWSPYTSKLLINRLGPIELLFDRLRHLLRSLYSFRRRSNIPPTALPFDREFKQAAESSGQKLRREVIISGWNRNPPIYLSGEHFVSEGHRLKWRRVAKPSANLDDKELEAKEPFHRSRRQRRHRRRISRSNLQDEGKLSTACLNKNGRIKPGCLEVIFKTSSPPSRKYRAIAKAFSSSSK